MIKIFTGIKNVKVFFELCFRQRENILSIRTPISNSVIL